MYVVSAVEVFAVMTQDTKASADCLIFVIGQKIHDKFFEQFKK